MLGRLVSFVKEMPGLGSVYRDMHLIYDARKYNSQRFLECQPPGHFNSPVPNAQDISENSATIFNRSPESNGGVELQENFQLDLLDQFSEFYGDISYTDEPDGGSRYYYDNGGWFGHFDALILHCMMRKFKPSQVIEVGSGFSSAVMLDADEKFLGGNTQFTFVDPYPTRLYSILGDVDKKKHNVVTSNIQKAQVEMFSALSENDILFIDSSHIVKIGSDVPHLLFNVLPQLKPGVIIHFHDIFWPFEYPEEWVMGRGRAWNEAYFLKAFLQNNSAFEIIFFNSFVEHKYASIVKEKMPLCLNTPGSSLWIRKKA